MNTEILEYLKFLHIHNLVDIIAIIESIPIYYQTQIKKFTLSPATVASEIAKKNDVIIQKMRLQNLTYIAANCFSFSFPNFKFDFQTFRMGPYSIDLENELQNLISSEVFNNAVSSKKQLLTRRYMIKDYNKDAIIDMFKGPDNYRNFLNTVDSKDIFLLQDISLALLFHNHILQNGVAKKIKILYTKNDINKYKILYNFLRGAVSFKKDYNAYIKELIDLVISLQQERNLQNLSF